MLFCFCIKGLVTQGNFSREFGNGQLHCIKKEHSSVTRGIFLTVSYANVLVFLNCLEQFACNFASFGIGFRERPKNRARFRRKGLFP